MVLDNLREGVIAPDIYDATLNPLYSDVLKHYGALALPCRLRDPDRKGKVESGVGHAQKTPLKGLRFENLEEAQTYAVNASNPAMAPAEPLRRQAQPIAIAIAAQQSIRNPRLIASEPVRPADGHAGFFAAK